MSYEVTELLRALAPPDFLVDHDSASHYIELREWALTASLTSILRMLDLREWAFYLSIRCSADSSAAQPASDSTAAQPASDSPPALVPSEIPSEAVLLIVRFVSAHNLETLWPCSECSPYWYDWYCHECRLVNQYLYWSHRRHFGHCGWTCHCCYSAGRNQSFNHGCQCCDDLWSLKGTCHTMRDMLKTYSGT